MSQKITAALLAGLSKELLGYLNFSSGNHDSNFFSTLNRLFGHCPLANNKDTRFSALRVVECLEKHLKQLAQESESFRVDDQAGLVLALIKEHFFTEYRKYHADLLFHQTDEILFNPFFMGKVFEAILKEGAPWTEHTRIIPAVISKLNDYIGYRPIPVLEGDEKHQPYAHEWVAPVPLYIKNIGVATGKYAPIVEQALEILTDTDPAILREACLDPEKIEELVLDPRAYDFDHPVNRKPNYHFGLWDPNSIDHDGFYCRFVTHQITLEGIYRRLETAYTGGGDTAAATVPFDELIFEAGAVLAGTMLMGAGICGEMPSTYSSETSLNDLMPMIADYRDSFYNQLILKIPEKMKPRIEKEKERLFQPFGGCRQDLNRQMAKRRADQLQRMHLARIFARMGYYDAAAKQANVIAVTSARLLTKIDCLITKTHTLITKRELSEAAGNLPVIENIIRRGITCGAVVDPWTIVGFGGAYSLFHTVENSIHDHRIDELINLMEEVFDIYSRLQKEAAASGNGDLHADLSDKMSDLAGWWDQFGSMDVSNIDSFSGNEAWESAAVVSTALAAWHKAGTAAGDIAFWSRHVERFKTTKAFVLLAEALLDQQDLVATMNLMMYWLERAEQIPLIESDYSFHAIAIRWMGQLWNHSKDDLDDKHSGHQHSGHRTADKKNPFVSFTERWTLTRKFFELLEANADYYWNVPTLELDDDCFEGKKGKRSGKKRPANKPPKPKSPFDSSGFDDDDFDSDADNFGENNDARSAKKRRNRDDDEDSDIFGAAYDNFTYKDSTDDGIDDSLMDQAPPSGFNKDEEDFEIADEINRIGDRLVFISTMSKLWQFVTERLAGFVLVPPDSPWQTDVVRADSLSADSGEEKREEITAATQEEIEQHLNDWHSHVKNHSSGLEDLMRQASAYKVPPPRGTADSLMEYDRHRGLKEIFLDRIVWAHVEVLDTKMIIESYLGEHVPAEGGEDWETAVLETCVKVFRCDVKAVKKMWKPMLDKLAVETILYIPTSRGGSAAEIVRCRRIQQAIIRLLEYAPRLGLLVELFDLLETIQEMEEVNKVSPGAITEFDRLVETASRSVTKCVVASATSWETKKMTKQALIRQNTVLIEYMDHVVKELLSYWISHSQHVRISPVEALLNKNFWNETKQFIQRYGHDIFTQHNMGFGNLRAILHQGVEHYLRSLMKIRQEDGEIEIAEKLLDDIAARRISWQAAAGHLEIILESIAENYSEYVDYNSTTTHSDRGEKLYMLLDMLRVQVQYDRYSWKMKPVYWVHDSMIRSGSEETAYLWERAVADRTVVEADDYLREYQRLSEKYGMWLPSVHERLQERFVRPLQIDRMCGLVSKAIRQAQRDEPKTFFDELYAQIENFAKDPLGVGFEMPEWLSALRNEVMTTRGSAVDSEKVDVERENGRDVFNSQPHFEQACLTKPQLDKSLEQIAQISAKRRRT